MLKVFGLCYLSCLLVQTIVDCEDIFHSVEEAEALDEGTTKGKLVFSKETGVLSDDTLPLQHELVNEEVKDSEESTLYEMVSWFWDDEDHSEMPSGRSEGSVSGRTVTETVIDSIRSRYQFVADSVIGIYAAMTDEDENYRFDLIVDQVTPPDLSFLYPICPNNCRLCAKDNPEIVCRACCPELFTEPVPVPRVFSLGSYSEMIFNILLSTIEMTGLTPVFGSFLQHNGGGDARQGHDAATQQVKALIRRFHWLRTLQSTWSGGVPRSEAFISERDGSGRFSVQPGQVCGYYEDTALRRGGRIMGGSQVIRTRQFPWQMSLATGFMGMFYQHRCGAALIAEFWVLTAAHCSLTLRGQTLYVMGGFLDINERETAQIIKVESVINHGNFIPSLYEQDIALLRLSAPVVYTPSLLPICLPQPTYGRSEEYRASQGHKAVLTGWGRQWDKGPLATQLEMVELPIISNAMCMAWYNRSGSRQFIPESTFLCAGWEEGRMDACSGDSGGPLVDYRPDGRAEVVGVVSWGIGCGVKGRPGVYTRVTEFVPWIKKKVWEYEKKRRY